MMLSLSLFLSQNSLARLGALAPVDTTDERPAHAILLVESRIDQWKPDGRSESGHTTVSFLWNIGA